MAPTTLPRLCPLFPADGSKGNTTVDIIAVHGLGTCSPHTWTTSKRDRNCHPVNWLVDKDMLPSVVPQARIWAFDYNSIYTDDSQNVKLLALGEALLAFICMNEELRRRPLLFIGSCFGGLVVVQALERASLHREEEHELLLQSTLGVIFLGTPLRGTDAARYGGWQIMLSEITGKAPSTTLLESLGRGSTLLRNIVEDFCKMTIRHGLELRCFYETKKTQVLNAILPRSIASLSSSTFVHLVTEESATLDGHEHIALDVNHSGMNKFKGPDDGSFKLVSDRIKRLVENAYDHLRARKVKKHNSAMFVVPYARNKSFVGRSSQIEKLTTILHKFDHHHRVAVVGLGGVGKTQCVLEYAYKVRELDMNCSIFWVYASTAERFRDSCLDIAKKLGLPSDDDAQTNAKQLVKDWLSSEKAGRWIMIVDNADDVDIFFTKAANGDKPLCDFLPQSSHGSIIFTTRDKKSANKLASGHQVDVEEMSVDDSMKVLRESLNDSDQVDTDPRTPKLLDLLAYLPLAIVQAASYINENEVSISDYVGEIEASGDSQIELLLEDFQDLARDTEQENAVATTWLISFKKVQQVDSLAADYLSFMSCLERQAIPRSMLPTGKSSLKQKQALATLKAYSFITERPGLDDPSFDVHRLVHLIMANWLKIEGLLGSVTRKALMQISEVFPTSDNKHRLLWNRYMPHALTILESPNIRSDELGVKKAECGLLYNVSGCLLGSGNYQKAETTAKWNCELRSSIFGKEDERTITSKNRLAEILERQGQYREAEELNREVLRVREKILTPQHHDILESKNNLAETLELQGKCDIAEQMDREVLAIREETLGPKHPETLISMCNLATVLEHEGNFKEAEEIIQKVMEARLEVLGAEHPDTLASIHRLGSILERLGKYKAAEDMDRKALEIMNQVLGPEHPETLKIMTNLSLALYREGKYHDAKDMTQEVIDISTRVLGPEHPSTTESMENLGLALERLGEYTAAESITRKALEITTRTQGEEDRHAMIQMNNLAMVLARQEKFAEAEQLGKRVIALEKRILGIEHQMTLASMNNLGTVRRNMGKFAESEEAHKEELAIGERVQGPNHPDTLNSVLNLAIVIGKQKRWDEATALFERTCSGHAEVLGSEHPETKGAKKLYEEMKTEMRAAKEVITLEGNRAEEHDCTTAASELATDIEGEG